MTCNMAKKPEEDRLSQLQEQLLHARSDTERTYLKIEIAKEESYQHGLRVLAELLLEIWMDKKREE